MRKLNTTLDREPMNSEAIRQRQNFNYILKETAAAKIPIWKSIWFYGPVGIAMVTMVVSAVRMNPQNQTNDNKTTLAQNDVIGYTGSTELGDLSTVANAEADIEKFEKEFDYTKAFEGTIPSQNETSKASKKSTIAAKSTDKVDDNTKLKPEVLAEEKNTSDINRNDPVKTVTVVQEVVAKPVKTMPNIAGVFSGRISVSQICSIGKIECNNGYQIISYDIQYDNGAGSTVDRVTGEEIPRYICGNLQRYNVGSPVFITNIIAMNEKGERKKLLSMSIEPTF